MSVQNFSTLDELLAVLAEHQAKAESTHGIPVKQGDYVIRVARTPLGMIPVLGRLDDPHAWRFQDGKTLESLDPDERAEYEAEVEDVRKDRERGYWFGKWFSVLTPQGELSNAHVSNFVMTITEEQFNAAKEAGWQVKVIVPEPIGDA